MPAQEMSVLARASRHRLHRVTPEPAHNARLHMTAVGRACFHGFASSEAPFVETALERGGRGPPQRLSSDTSRISGRGPHIKGDSSPAWRQPRTSGPVAVLTFCTRLISPWQTGYRDREVIHAVRPGRTEA